MFTGLLQDWTTVSGVGDVPVTQSAAEWLELEAYSGVTFWLEVRDFTSDNMTNVTLSYQTSPTQDEAFFLPMGAVSLASSGTPFVTKIRLGDNPTTALARYVRWSIANPGQFAVNWSATFRIFFVATNGVEGPRGIPGDTSGFRLSLTSGTPVTTSDTTGTTIYLTPYIHSQIVLYDGTAWAAYDAGEVALTPSLAANQIYDVFASYDLASSAVKLELSNTWTNDTTRSDAVSRKDGVLVKASDPTRRLIGTVRTNGSSQLVDTAKQRFVWNARNQVDRFLSVVESTASWTYGTASYRAARGQTSNSFEYVTGDVAALHANVHAVCQGSATGQIATVGIGIDSTTANSAQIFGKTTETTGVGSDSTHAEYRGYTAAGHHTITWLEMAGATITFFGKNGTPAWQVSGMNGRIAA